MPIKVTLSLTLSIPTRYSCSLPPQACADKLKNELQQYGFPPVFPRDVEEKKSEKKKAKDTKVKPVFSSMLGTVLRFIASMRL